VIELFSYPTLYGVADNNPYGLKIYAFLKLCKLAFQHNHVFEAKSAPRGQLPYIVDDGEIIGDSDAIVSHLTRKHRLSIDDSLSESQRDTGYLIARALDDLYWVMSYSRWRDPRFWPIFRDEVLKTHPSVTRSGIEAAQKYNFERYYYQGIGRYEPERPTSIDAALYGFAANIYFFKIETPLKAFVLSRPELVRHCNTLHAAVTA
jgi:glutathione S-transferase